MNPVIMPNPVESNKCCYLGPALSNPIIGHLDRARQIMDHMLTLGL